MWFRITRRYDTDAAPILERWFPWEVDSIFRKPSCLQLQDEGTRGSHITVKVDTARFSEMSSPFPYGAVTSKTVSTSTIFQTVITFYRFTPSVTAKNILKVRPKARMQTGNFCGYTSTTVTVRFHMCKHTCRSTVSSRQRQLNKLQQIQAFEFNRLCQVLPSAVAALPTNQPTNQQY
jgi:hypothetical protein